MDAPEPSSPSSIVRTAAVLHLDSPRASDALRNGDCGEEAVPDVDLSQYNVKFEEFTLPALDGTKLQRDLDHVRPRGDTTPAPSCKEDLDYLTSVSSPDLRLKALQRALERAYASTDGSGGGSAPEASTTACAVTPAADSTTGAFGSNLCFIGPGGPAAVVTLKLPPDPEAQSRHSDGANTAVLSAFPPPWLPSLARSLTFLDLSFSTCLDPAAWDLSALAVLPRLACIKLRGAKLISALPADLPARLPVLQVLDIHAAQFQLPCEQLTAMLVALAAAPDDFGGGRRQLVLSTCGAESGARGGMRTRRRQPTQKQSLEVRYEVVKEIGDGQTSSEWEEVTDAEAMRAVLAACERAFMSYAREMWWQLELAGGPAAAGGSEVPLGGQKTAMMTQPLDISMMRLVHDLGLLPPPPAEEEEAKAGEAEPGARPQGEKREEAKKGSGDGAEDSGEQFRISDRDTRSSTTLRLADVRLQLAWPYASPRIDAPTWSHEQGLHSAFRDKYGVCLSTRQWLLLLADEGREAPAPPLLPAAAPAPDLAPGDPFAFEAIPFQALEQRERLTAGALYAASTGRAEGMFSSGTAFRTGESSQSSHGALKTLAFAKERPPPTVRVAVPTAAALAARSRARRMLVAGLLGVTEAAVSPAARGSVSLAMLLTALRLESRLYGRVRRVSILSPDHPARAATHAGRYWASVHALRDTLHADLRVRMGLLVGTVPLAAASELAAEELRALVAKLDKAAKKAPGRGAGMLAERAAAAADVGDMEALQKQVAAGGRLNEQVPVFVEDWLPAERSLDSLCAWHIADPRVWPHGSLLHGAVALGHVRTAAWLLDRGLPLNGCISMWELTPLHLCCMRPMLWRSVGHMFHFLRLPSREPAAAPAPAPKETGDDSDDSSDRGAPYGRRRDDPSDMASAFDCKLGLPTGSFLGPRALVFPGVCSMWTEKVSHDVSLGPTWYCLDDEIRPGGSAASKDRLQSLHARGLPCTAVASSGAAAAAAASPAALAAAAPPMLRLLLGRGPELAPKSWCGVLPVHYAAATCGPETLAALAEAGASLRVPLPGSLVGPLHLFAHRAACRWSGLTPGAAARLLSCRPVVNAADVLAQRDEWRCSPLTWLVQAGEALAPTALGALLGSLRSGLGSGGGAGGRGSGGKAAVVLSNDALEGLGRTLSYAIMYVQVDHVRELLQHFPEAASVALAPVGATPLHLAALLPACSELGQGHILRVMAKGELLKLQAGNEVPKFIRDQLPPYVPPSAVRQLSAAVAVGGGCELLVLGGDEPVTATADVVSATAAGGGSGCEGGNKEEWPMWTYPLVDAGPSSVHASESLTAVMQRYLEAQQQLVHMLLAAGAPVDAADWSGCTPLMVAVLAGAPPVVAALLDKGASVTTSARCLNVFHETFSRKRLKQTLAMSGSRVLGLDYLLLAGPSASSPQPSSAQQAAVAAGGAGDVLKLQAGAEQGRDADSADGSTESESEYDTNERPEAGKPYVLGDEFLVDPKRGSKASWESQFPDAHLTPLTAAVVRVMQRMYFERVTPDAQGPGSTVRRMAFGEPANSAVNYSDTDGRGRLSRFGDGILWLLMRHGPPELRAAVLRALQGSSTTELVAEMPRTAVWVVGAALPGNRYVAYAERAAREACATLSPFTTSSLDAAIQKALNLAVEEAGNKGGEGKKGTTARQQQQQSRGPGGATWGPYEDEVLADLMMNGLYPLFMSPNMTNGEASILRMSVELLKFSNCMQIGKQALLEAHARQFTPAASSAAGNDTTTDAVTAVGGAVLAATIPATAVSGSGSLTAAAEGAAGGGAWSMENIETLLVGSYDTACGYSQQIVRSPPQGQEAAGQEAAGLGAPAAQGGGGGGRMGSSVLVLHTQEDMEAGITYARACEVLPPVTTMRIALGHHATLPHIIIRGLAETMFKFVRTLCHVSQPELDWVRLPGGVTTTSVDGLFLPAVPGEASWNVTDMFRPRNFGFRLSFLYTRRTLTIEMHALTLTRSVPICINDDPGAVANPVTAAGGAGAAGEAAGAAGPAPNAAVRGVKPVGAAAVTHSRAEEFGFWTRNPDVVRMEQVQSMAGRLEQTALLVGGNFRQMPVPPVWWTTGWVDRFLRLFLLGALSGEAELMAKIKLRTLYDTSVQDPWSSPDGPAGQQLPGAAPPWTTLETNVLASLLSLHPLSLENGRNDDAKGRDLAGRTLRQKDLRRMEEVLELPICEQIAGMVEDANLDRGCIVFTAQWNTLARGRKWPVRSTLQVQDVIFRLVRMSSCSYKTSWEASLQSMMGLLMSGDISPELRRETECKLLSLASDTAFARRLVWGMCRGRRSEAKTMALLSGVVEFQPLLVEALLEHEAKCKAVSQWHQQEHCWAVAGGPALERLQPERLALLLQIRHSLPTRPLVVPYNAAGSLLALSEQRASEAAAAGAAAAGGTAAGAGAQPPAPAKRVMYCRFSNREELELAVETPLAVDDDSAARSGTARGTSSLVALLPVSLWEAAAVPSAQLPRREASSALSFFSLVFSRLPRGLQRADNWAAGTMWGSGLPAVLLHRRPAAYRWSPWGPEPDVGEEAAVVGTLFDAHAAEPLPKAWLRELDANENGLVAYREFLLAYLRHRAGDFLGPQAAGSLLRNATKQVSGVKDAAADAVTKSGAAGEGGAAAGPAPALPAAPSRGWQQAAKVVQGQLSQAFWDRANALKRLRDQEGDTQAAATQDDLMAAERDPGGAAAARLAGQGAVSSGGMAAVRQLGARALGALGGGSVAGFGTGSGQLPSMALAGVDCLAPEEACEVQRCAWVVYGNLRSAARYLQAAQSDGCVSAAPCTAGTAHSASMAGVAAAFGAASSGRPQLTMWQVAERTALDGILRGVRRPNALFVGSSEATEAEEGAASTRLTGGVGEGGGPRSWLLALSGAVAGAPGGTSANAAVGRPHSRDSALLELLLDLATCTGAAAHSDLLAEGLERPVGPMGGASPLLLGRTLASAVTQVGADAAAELASAMGGLVLANAAAAASRDGLSAPLGGPDEAFCASALKLAAEEVWAFVTDMQSLVDSVVSPLVAAADQSLPIIQRDSIKTIFGDTNIELILEYEIELLKLLTVNWRSGARTAMVVPFVVGPAQYLLTSVQRRVAASRLRAFTGEFAPTAEQLGLDPLSHGVQLRPVLTDPGVAAEVLELLLRLATAYQNYLDKIDASLQELLSCLERDDKGTFSALLRRFGRPVKVKRDRGRAATPVQANGATAAADDDSDDSDDSGDGKPSVTAAAPSAAANDVKDKGNGKGGRKDKDDAKAAGGAGVRLELPHHHVRPLLSVRQMARYGPGAEVEACLRKPAAHLATLAFLSTVCRSITAAEDQLGGLDTGVKDGDQDAAALGGAAATAAIMAAAAKRSKGGKTVTWAPSGRRSRTTGGSGASAPGAGLLGALRRLWQRVVGSNMARVLPLGADVHPLFQLPAPGPSGVPRAAAAAMAEHRVVLRGVGAGILTAAAGGSKRAGLGSLTLGEQLDVWMEERLLSGGIASRLLLAVCTAFTCFTWRLVPLLSERRRYLEDLRVANNLLHHRKVVRQLERAINVRPEDDEALEQEVALLHQAIRKGVEDATNEMDIGEADKMSPMSVEAGFWNKSAPRRQQDLEPLRAALRLAEERTLHSTFAGARLVSNARRCAARSAAANAKGGAGGATGTSKRSVGASGGGGGKRGGDGDADGDESDEDEAERVLDALAAPPPVRKKQPPPPPPPAKSGAEGGGGGSGAAVQMQLAQLFGSKARPEAEAAGGGAPKAAWGVGLAATASVARRAAHFAATLRRAVRRREHARRRWDKTLYLVMQSGALDDAVLAREHATTMAQLRRTAALSAWRQLRGAGDDVLMVFGAVAFRDVGRVFAPLMATFLMTFPFAVLGVALRINPDNRQDRLLMGGMVGCYVLTGFFAMAAAVAQLRRDPSQLKVYRPSDTIRFPNFRRGTALASWKAHWVNVFAICTLVLEFWQLCAFSYQRRIPYPESSFLKKIFPWALLDLGPAAYFLQVFALLAFMIVWIAVFFPQTPAGLKRVIMPFLGQAAYLTITSGLLSQLDCRMDTGTLVRNPDITCWTQARHLYGAVASMLAMGLYVPRATLTPFEVFFPSENLDIKYRGLYVRVVQLLRLGMAGYNLFFAETFPLTVMLANAGVCALLAAMTAIMWPCCIGAVNIGRGTGFVLATWSQAVSAAALRLSPDVFMDPSSRQWYTNSWSYVYALVGGWAVIAAGGYWLLRRHLRRRDSAAIRFSLKDSPFNYTLPRGPPEAATQGETGGAAGPAKAAEQQPPPPPPPSSQQQQQRPPPPPGRGFAITAFEDGGAGSGTAAGGNLASTERQREEAARASSSSSDDGAKGSGGGSDRGDDDAGSDKDSDADEASSEGAGEAEGESTAAASAAADAFNFEDVLGLPVVSRKLVNELAAQGLLTPADEMRSYMAELVRTAQRRLAGDRDDDNGDGDR